MSRRHIPALLLLVMVIAVAIERPLVGDTPEGSDRPLKAVANDGSHPDAPPVRNVILISLDTTRWDAISAYNAPEVNSPNIAAIGREGVVFENAFAPMPVTLPSHATMLTGKIPPAHGVLDNGRYTLADRHVTLAEVMKENGFNTGAFLSALVMESKFGLDQGFDVYDDEIDETSIIGERRGDRTTSKAIEWIRKNRDEKNFLFLHLFDPHAPYEAPESFATKIRTLYKKYPRYIQDYVAEVAFTDHCIGLLIDALKELELYEESLICITADHGESHGEHGENTHGFYIYTSTMRVPLIFKIPGSVDPIRVTDTVGIVDVFPTIISLSGLKKVSEIQGVDLAKVIRDKTTRIPQRTLFTMSIEPMKYGGQGLFGIIAGGYQYIETAQPELYALSSDVYEKNNLIDSERSLAKKLRAGLQSILAEFPVETDDGYRSVDTATRQRLEALGYVTTRTEEAPSTIDAKDLIEYHKKNLIALTYVAPENRDAALAACEDMIRMRPDFHLGYQMMGTVLMASGRQGDAAPFFEKAEALGAGDPN